MAFFIIFTVSSELKSQEPFQSGNVTKNKILSGLLFEKTGEVLTDPEELLKKALPKKDNLILYFRDYPDGSEISNPEELGIRLWKETWTPAGKNHPYGFMVATVPFQNFQKILELPVVIKADVAGRIYREQNNDAARSIKAPMVWDTGYTGKGVIIGILDSGIDTSYKWTELPSVF